MQPWLSCYRLPAVLCTGPNRDSMIDELLSRLRASEPHGAISPLARREDEMLLAEWLASGIHFVASAPYMENQYYRAVRELFSCIKPTIDANPILQEGGVYFGCWLESTGTINAELLSRFLPSVARRTFAAFAAHQREDGCLPYKLTIDGAVFSQIQLVSPLARSVWTDYALNGPDPVYLRTMYDAMSRYDGWLARHRNTLGTGAVEAFCTFDTGHDLSSRFWHIPDSPFRNDPAQYNRENPFLPLIAPDLTANVACQRNYLAKLSELLGEDGSQWLDASDQSERALWHQCFDETDGFFYDRDRHGRLHKVQSDVLLRVLACEIGPDTFFAEALSRYLLNTRKFFAKYPFTSIALDDPRFDPAFTYNSWSGPSNFLSVIRAPHAFEHHHRHVELTWVLQPILSALFKMERFAQTMNPFTGEPGFTDAYSPAILCLLDFVERLCGIQPRPDGMLWFTGLVPAQIDHRDAAHSTGYSRIVDGARYELINTPEQTAAFRDGEPLYRAPAGLRVATDRSGTITSVTGMTLTPVIGEIVTPNGRFPISITANQRLLLEQGKWRKYADPGVVFPTT